MVLLFQCRKCGKFFCRSKHYTASVSNIYCVKIITPCNINRQRILMIPCFIFYRNSKYACKDISYSHFNLVLLKVKFLSYFKFMQTVTKLIFLIQKQISVKCFQILCCFVNTFLQIRIVSADKCISERKKRLLRLGNRRQINVLNVFNFQFLCSKHFTKDIIYCVSISSLGC